MATDGWRAALDRSTLNLAASQAADAWTDAHDTYAIAHAVALVSSAVCSPRLHQGRLYIYVYALAYTIAY